VTVSRRSVIMQWPVGPKGRLTSRETDWSAVRVGCVRRAVLLRLWTLAVRAVRWLDEGQPHHRSRRNLISTGWEHKGDLVRVQVHGDHGGIDDFASWIATLVVFDVADLRRRGGRTSGCRY
jgi:hypothetical protein